MRVELVRTVNKDDTCSDEDDNGSEVDSSASVVEIEVTKDDCSSEEVIGSVVEDANLVEDDAS